MASLERSIENFESEGWVLVSQSEPPPELRLDVALLPNLVRDAPSVFAVVDVLRASTSIITLLERGGAGGRPAGGFPAPSSAASGPAWRRPGSTTATRRRSSPP